MSQSKATFERDASLMRRCCELAAQAAGYTAPNPLVGSVITQGDEIVGEGFHPQAGQPHAEIFALRAAGGRTQGATLYVNLEPCNHTGRTPPCSDAVIEAGIQRVVIGMRDPNPKAKGGIEKLRQAGIEVVTGIEADRCRQLNEAFIHRVQHHKPFGILKYAMTLDGKIATTTGHSAWISGPRSRQQVHQLRSRCDVVIVGGNTVRRDNPNLTSHAEGTRNPLRVVMSRQLALPTAANLWEIAQAPTLVFTQTDANPKIKAALIDQGVEIEAMKSLTPDAVMARLYQRGAMSVLWECGGTLAAQAIATGSVQKVWAFVAPKLIGGSSAPSPIGDLGFTEMTEALTLRSVSMTPIGQDFLLEGYL
ncbi:bifunctional diaminohydroxyphosphoribosylaminopyrimidine deaminase/5-amino-6-(5-phosphoribosylamino)uracil reductase RibD [cf. Phormidesmis sp. LEGE 11477]|uniref:bifunctional diaminohydroxyphosphoribosylaminopyrimidine deaminase/5-amino-6-(5-phosphoribosylamino)uracil reductase RibD n=1 Tax=cf. Phormidesmis sp. LEGE 11477 TaxID=1828680 RepID=UPI0018820D07|nr:bifunctional diaminohydroxyphosphoribosylaminopyrimidine deaminase/5-amino-6-(5-phosphoribosylamino)uracil reductase RibD [cf. Phormidesmis sp. LEGE 11477]MBE9063393.1 bifunctional diaminohydroxyphosphoribosylaminopyrimidine deaminase/5-amino-6-(5-phosphoribosylamino)uracil reductase RibD [cf. Phormidesmis sp. LEGE 11477]